MRKTPFRLLSSMVTSSTVLRQNSLNIHQKCYDLKNEADRYLETLKQQNNLDPIRLLKAKLDILWTYHSFALNGTASLLHDDISRLLKDNLTSDNKNFYEQLDAKNHTVAIQYCYLLCNMHITDGRPSNFTLDPNDNKLFSNIHTTFTLIMYSGYGGAVSSEYGDYCPPGLFNFMDRDEEQKHLKNGRDLLIKALKNEGDSFEIAANIHQEIEAAYHEDKHKGIFSRLNMNLSLMLQGFFPAIIHVEQKNEYLAVMKAYDENKNSAPIADFISECLKNTYEQYIIPDLIKSLEQPHRTVMKLT